MELNTTYILLAALKLIKDSILIILNRVPKCDVIEMKFVKLWDLLRYSERTTSKTPNRQKLAIWGTLSLRN